MSKVQFEALDILLFTFIGAVAECINMWVFSKFSTSYYVSLAVVLGLISMVRWGWPGIIVTLGSGLASILYESFIGTSNSVSWMLANTIGYLPMLVCLLFFRNGGKKEVGTMWGTMILYVVTGFLSSEVGKALCYIGEVNAGRAVLVFVAYDLINWVLGLIVFFIACKQKTLVVDMTDYIREVQGENKEAKFREETKDYRSLEEMADKDEVSDISLLDGGMVTAEQIEEQQAVYRKMEGQASKFDEENAAIKTFEKNKKNDKKKSGGK